MTPRPGPLEVGLASFIGLTAIDGARLANRPSMVLLAGTVVAAFLILVGSWRSSAMNPIPRVRPNLPFALTASWVGWAAIAPVIGFGGFSALTMAGLYAIVLLGLVGVAHSSGSLGVARIGIGAFGVYLGASMVLIAGGQLDAFNDDSRLMLGSLEPNQLARAAAIATVCGLWLLARGPRPWAAFGAVAALAGSGIVLASGSRTGLAAFLVGVSVLAVHASRRPLAAAAMAILLTLVAGSLLGVVDFGDSSVSVAERLQQTPDGSTSTLSGRDTLWPVIWDVALERPVTGHGLGEDRELVADNLDVGWGPQHAHNLGLHVLLTTGFVGLILLGLGLGDGLLHAARRQLPLEFALLLIVVVDGISEPVVRVPAFGWFALGGALVLVGQTANIQEAGFSPTEPDLTSV